MNLETVLTTLSEDEQYSVGFEAGKILRRIHSVEVRETDLLNGNWKDRYSKFIDQGIKSFQASKIQVKDSDFLINYYIENQSCLDSRPLSYIHGDYHPGNLMYNESKLSVIDWEIHLFDYCADPWWEVLYHFPNPTYSNGLLNGYFDREPSKEFWKVYSIYAAITAVSSITWAYYMCPEALDEKIKFCSDVVEWFDYMKNTIPTWYKKKP